MYVCERNPLSKELGSNDCNMCQNDNAVFTGKQVIYIILNQIGNIFKGHVRKKTEKN